MSAERDEVLARLLASNLPATEAAELDRLLAADPELRREAADLVGMDRLLRYHSYLETEDPDIVVGVMCRIKIENLDDTRSFAEKVSRQCAEPAAPAFKPMSRRITRRASARTTRAAARSSRRGAARSARAGGRGRVPAWVPVAAAAAVLLAAAAIGYRLARKPTPLPAGPAPWTARAGTFSGQVALVRAGTRSVLTGGEHLAPGDRLETSESAKAALSYDDGSAVEINERTSLALGSAADAKHLTVEHGDAYIRCASQPVGRPMLLNPGGHDQVEVVGTELAISVMPREVTVVQVSDGHVLFGSGKSRTAVSSGFQSRALPGRAPGPPEPVAAAEFAAWRHPATTVAVKTSPDAPPEQPKPQPPTLRPLQLSTPEDTPKQFQLSASPNDGQVRFEIDRQPEHGALTGTPPDLTYTPAENYSGADGFTFRATAGNGLSSTAEAYIRVTPVNDPPVARAAAEPHKGIVPLTVKFDASDSSDVDGKVVDWQWNFRDDFSGKGRQVEHVFRWPGKYVVELTVRDDGGKTGTAEVEIVVEKDPNEIAAPTALTGHRGGRPVRFVLTWKDNSDNEEGFVIERAEAPPAGTRLTPDKFVYRELARAGANVTQAQVELTPTPRKKSTFWFRVSAFNTKTGRTSRHAIFIVTVDPQSPNKTLNWPPPEEAGSTRQEGTK